MEEVKWLNKEIQTQFENGRQIVSIVGMRQIGKSTIMRQTIRSLLRKGIPAESIFYVSFDDPFLEAESQNSNSDLMENVVAAYSQFILRESLLGRVGGFPRAWEEKLDFASRQRVLWEQHIVKVLYEDLVQATGIRKPKELAHLFIRIVQWNGNGFRLRDLQEDLRISNLTLEKYLEYFIKTFLVFRVDKTKTKRYEVKRKTGYVKFYVTDVAFRNALYKRDETIFENPEEMGLVAENLVCSLARRWITAPYREDAIQFYKDNSGEVDFIIKQPEKTIPIEVASTPNLRHLACKR